jgi:methyl-accepting chemotaxis protein
MRVSHAIVLAMLVPIAAAVLFAASLVLRENDKLSGLENLSRLIELSVRMSTLVHEQQKERGATAVFLGSNGKKFAQELSRQTQETDVLRREFEEFAAGFEREGVDEKFHHDFDAILAELARLDTIRRSVTSLSISGPEAIAYYTNMNGMVLDLVGHFANLSNDPKIVPRLLGYESFLKAKERAGIERAIGANGFAAGVFTAEAMDKLKELISTQSVLNSIFLSKATDEQVRLYERVMNSDAAADVERMRAVAIAGGLEGLLQGVSGQRWFESMTQKIDGLKEIEVLLEHDLMAEMKDHQNDSVAEMRFELAIAGITLFLALAASILVTVTISRSFRNLVEPTLRMAEGDLDAPLPPETRNEFGDMTRALKVFRDNALARIEAEAAEARERDAREAEANVRHKAMERLQQSLTIAVEAASAGDFTQRVDTGFEAEDLLSVAGAVNALLVTVEGGVGEVGRVISGLADGVLTVRMEGDYSGAFQRLQEDVNSTINRLNQLVGELQATSMTVLDATREISQGANDLSSRAENQAASLEETAATMEEIAATAKTNAENAAQANSLAGETRAQAEHGREVTADTVKAMTNIRESATEIGDIVTTIESIAFQTNLLALNAAVEAARAGDAGKGFAVVASEVRTLAQRSGEAAKTIKDLIDKSTEHVAAGDRLVGATDTALSGIVESVRNVARTIEEIASASREQTSGIDEVSIAVSQMDEMTQQNASIADQSAASSRSLTEQSENLVELIRFFTTEAGNVETQSERRAGEHDLRAWDRDSRVEAASGPSRRAAVPAPKAAAPKVAAVADGGDWAEF